ncbi:unnamed protein product [Paramecium octaurelia]|uniref:Uncharacterized protein n=1 Tax=Paramecium octaurelia TaxID=43137 RepID=A0A8S1SCQ2_PAROT|nr:unnamed protein product [Paramecium octaurelia]
MMKEVMVFRLESGLKLLLNLILILGLFGMVNLIMGRKLVDGIPTDTPILIFSQTKQEGSFPE